METFGRCMGCMRPLNGNRICPVCKFQIEDYHPNPRCLKPGAILNGKFVVGKVLGEGGFGITYMGWDNVLDMPVAIKEYFPSSIASRDTTTGISDKINVFEGKTEQIYNDGLNRYVREAKSLSKFHELPGIVSIRDFFFLNETAYIIMEFLDGKDLREHITQKGKMKPEYVFQLMKPVMRSLEQIHQFGMVHRDISPDNIMITKNGQVKLIDFGAARATNNEDNKSLTIMLKRGFAPKEQYTSKGQQGPWTDVYAISATMYYMITGKVPPESMERLEDDTIKSIREMGIVISRQREEAIFKGMAVAVDDRYQSIRDLYRDLYKEEIPVTPNADLFIGGSMENVVQKQRDEEKIQQEERRLSEQIIKGTGNIETVLEPDDGIKNMETVLEPDGGMKNMETVLEPDSGMGNMETVLELDGGIGNMETVLEPTGGMGNMETVLEPTGGIGNMETVLEPAGGIGNMETILEPTGSMGNAKSMQESVKDRGTIASMQNKPSQKSGTMPQFVGSAHTGYVPKQRYIKKYIFITLGIVFAAVAIAGIIIVNSSFLNGGESDKPVSNEVMTTFMPPASDIPQSSPDSSDDGTTHVPQQTNENVEVKMPDVVNKKDEDAIKILKKLDETLQISKENVYSEKIKKGLVISQNISAKKEFQKGKNTKIILKVSMGPERISVPDVVGKSREKAQKLIVKKKLKYRLTYEYNSSIPKGKVIRQGIKAGKKVKKNTKITICISDGKKPVEPTIKPAIKPTSPPVVRQTEKPVVKQTKKPTVRVTKKPTTKKPDDDGGDEWKLIN